MDGTLTVCIALGSYIGSYGYISYKMRLVYYKPYTWLAIEKYSEVLVN